MQRIQMAISFVIILLGWGCNTDSQTVAADSHTVGTDSHTVAVRSQAVLDTITEYENSTKQFQSDRIPDSVFQMINLKNLTITGMDCDYGGDSCWTISEIPKQIARLVNLEILSLQGNGIRTLPNEMTTLKKLKYLNLTDNPGLEQIDVVTKVDNLEILILFGCNIRQLPIDMGRLKHLNSLDLSGNPISETELQRVKKALPNCEIHF